MQRFLKSNYLLLGILALAFLFRFWQITTLPGGLFPDEAANGLDVNSILRGHLQPFYERGNGREALFFYFLAIAVKLFGRGPWQHHIVSAGFGFFSVFLTYFIAKRLFNKNVGLLATFFMAVSSYATTLSRTAFRANTLPLFAILTLLCLLKFFQTENKRTKLWTAVAAGVTFALGFYTYIAYRMMIPLLGLLLIILLYSQRDRLKEIIKTYWSQAAIFVIVFLIMITPLALYFAHHPDMIAGRAGQVSIFSKDLNHGDVLGTFWTVFKKTMSGFFFEGDLNWRHNVSGYPFLSPLISPFFAVALLIFSLAALKLLREAWQKKVTAETLSLSLVALWFWFMLAPEVTTAEGIPHGLRLAGVMPAIFIMPAWLIDKIWTKIKDLSFKAQINKSVVAAVFLLVLFFYNFYLYFGVAASSPDYYYAFRSDLTTVSNYLNARNQAQKTYLSLDKFSVQTVDYLTTTTNQPYVLVDPARTFELRLQKDDQVVFTQSTLFDRLKFLGTHPNAKLVRTEQNQFGQIIMLVYEQK